VLPRIVWLDEVKNLSWNQVPLSHLYQRTFFPKVPRMIGAHKEVGKSMVCSECGCGGSFPSHFCESPSCNVAVCDFCAARMHGITALSGDHRMYMMRHEVHAKMRVPVSTYIARPTLLIVFDLMEAVSELFIASDLRCTLCDVGV
jgi:hypothetical protein